MVRFNIATAATALLGLCATVSAKPTAKRQDVQVPAGMGYDPSLAWDDSNVPDPQLVPIPPRQARFNPGVPLVAPPSAFNESSDVAKRYILGGVDNRFLLVSDDYPFRVVGKIVWANGVFCTGSLIGPRHVLTARHCIPSNGMGARFMPRYDNGATPYGTANMQIAVWVDYGYGPSSQCEWKEDWSVWIIDQRMGDNLGYFGAKTFSSGELNRPIMYTSGYPGDKDNGNRPYHMNSITVRSQGSFQCDAYGPLYTDADIMGGQSGSPLWEKDASNSRYVWGTLVVGTGTDSVAGSGNYMVDNIIRLRNEYP